MTTHELLRSLRKLQSKLESQSNFSVFVSRISSHYENITTVLSPLLSNTDVNLINEQMNALRTKINAAVIDIKTFSLPRVFIEIEKVKDALAEVQQELGSKPNEGLNNLYQVVSNFQDTFERMIKISEPAETLSLVANAKAVNNTLATTTDFVALLIEDLSKEAHPNPDEQELSLLFTSTDEYKDILSKLDAIDAIYSELCILFNVSKSEYPLRIVKLESGSLWLYIIGHALVIGFIISLVRSAIGFIYRNYTVEGKITLIPRELEAANKVLQFSNKLEEAGIDTAASRENVQKALFNISSKLNRLVADQPSMEINDEKISVGQAQEEKFLQESKRLLLEDGSQDTKEG